MEQETLTASQEQAVQPSSFASRATDVFASPGNLYAEVAETKVHTTSWLIPFIISLLLGVVFTISIFNNPDLRQQVKDRQEQEIRKQAAEGKMTQEQASQAIDRMESVSPLIFIVIGAGFACIVITAMYFGISLVLWITAKLALKFPGPYSKLLEVFALSSLISILGTIVTLLLVNLMGSLYATPSPALAIVSSFDPSNMLHRLLSSLGVFTIWQVVVLGIGLGKVTRSSVSTSVGIVFGLWVVWLAVSILLGWGFK